MNLNIERVLYLALTFLFTIGKIKFNDNMIERVEKNNNDFKKLIIYSLRDREKLKEYEFNPKGLNIILGKKENEDETNGVGKTTMVDCLQMLLGKSISNYYENNVILIERNPFIVLEVEVRGETIFLGRLFTSPRNGYILRLEKVSFDINDWEK